MTNVRALSEYQRGTRVTGIVELDNLQEQLNLLRAKLTKPQSTETNGDPTPFVTAHLVREVLRSRRRREEMFGAELFGEPAWDLLLELYAAELAQQKISISAACIASAVPATTALRWIDKLEKEGWVRRTSDPLDARRYWLHLTDRGSATMREYLQSMALRPV